MQDFDPLNCPLRGCVFIEASAGTGKTHSITSLVLRLVLEQRHELARILLVTYTNAATDELRRKTRTRLTLALQQLEGRDLPDGETPDPLVCELIEHQRIEASSASIRLRQALLQFDELSILTIHSFCQRVLRDRAFESGQLFNTELEPDETAIIQETVLDFWRTLLPRQPRSFFTFLRLRHRGLDDLMTLTRTALSRTDAAILPRAESSFVGPFETAMGECVEQARQILENEREEVLRVLEEAALDARVYQSRRLRSWLAQVENWLQLTTPLPSECKALHHFTNGALSEATSAGQAAPSHEFFDVCDKLQETGATVEAMLERQWIQVKRDLLDYLRANLPARKQRLNRYAYDDLLQNTLHALRDAGTELTDSLAEQYPVVLIDEFQDTDPTQYGIFQHLHESPRHELLCLIGDPKQAIYGFRGGDIFTYTHARAQADHVATLSENWRSTAALVRAVNTLYQAGPRPFWTSAIQYRKVRPAGLSPEARQYRLCGEDTTLAPMQIWQLPGARTGYQTEQGCIEASCQEIIRLIQLGREGTLEINGRPLQPSDIAILIRSHYQTTGLQRRLQQLGVRSVSYDRQHIFQTLEAKNLEILLQVLATPRDENLLKALLLNELMGFSEQDLDAALADEGRWGALLETMVSYRTQWKAEGFIVMFRRFLREEHLSQRLLALPNGERRLTNILQLSELTEEAQASAKLSIHATLQWYWQQRSSRLSEEKELRLESDDDRVKILTIHRSKGLEFPFVFLPYAWAGSATRRKPDHVAFHRQDEEAYVRCIDVGSDAFESNLALSREEESAEELRMLYVALTRAQHRVYLLAVPDSPKYKTSSLAYLWHHRESDLDGPIVHVHERLQRLSAARFREDYMRLVGAGEGSISLRTWEGRATTCLPPAGDAPVQEARRFRGRLAKHWGITSYSGLAGHRETLDTPDRDTNESPPVPQFPAAQLSGMAALPRGTRTGNMFHLLYENVAFDADAATIREAAAIQLATHGMPVEEWLDIVTRHTEEFFQSDLGGFTLADIPASKRLNELAFHFPIDRLDAARLQTFFTEHVPALKPNQFDFQPVEGFLKGFIDLVLEHDGRFYIIDYKSNFLGPEDKDYHSSLLPHIMTETNYVLQYHLYVVALHRYLRYRLGKTYDYERHSGGVHYLFVRGIRASTSPEYGVFHDRPPLERIEALSSMLSQTEPQPYA